MKKNSEKRRIAKEIAGEAIAESKKMNGAIVERPWSEELASVLFELSDESCGSIESGFSLCEIYSLNAYQRPPYEYHWRVELFVSDRTLN